MTTKTTTPEKALRDAYEHGEYWAVREMSDRRASAASAARAHLDSPEVRATMTTTYRLTLPRKADFTADYPTLIKAIIASRHKGTWTVLDSDGSQRPEWGHSLFFAGDDLHVGDTALADEPGDETGAYCPRITRID
jgi:hypothetical protein